MNTTPVESYSYLGREWLVKREDLAFPPPYPPLAKLRGIYPYIKGLQEAGAKAVGILDTRVSKSGQGVALVSEALGIPCHYYYMAGHWTDSLEIAQAHGAELRPLKGSKVGIMWARARQVEEGLMLPLGLPFPETAAATALEAERLAELCNGATILLSVGTGTILAGICLGLAKAGAVPRRIYGITASMDPRKVIRRLNTLWHQAGVDTGPVAAVTRVIKGGADYYEPGLATPPWPAHPYYEAKALDWAGSHMGLLPGPLVFWNIGA